jgi:hypothetical protein
MKKRYIPLLLAFAIITNINISAQTTDSPNTTATNNHIPNIIPPTPTVASLMKFEEIPVSKYTGVPDVSIPLFNVGGDMGLNMNISMKYHPLSIKKDEVAGYTGLGWSLFAGGTISRTVRDIPDEYYGGEGPTNKKIGIYDSRNNYYDVLPLLNDTYSIDFNDPKINEFFYEASEKQKYDAKQDVYQYNFMGYSGKFMIEKTGSNYNVVKLTKDNLRITYNNTTKIFEITDDKGLKYVFDVKEQSENYSFTENIPFTGTSNISNSYNYNYISSFHLSKVFSENNLLAEFIYNPDDELFIEKQTTINSIHNLPVNPGLELYIQAHQGGDCGSYIPSALLPLDSNQSNTVETKTKKLKQIKITGKAIIDFTTLKGSRQDQNIIAGSNTPYLSQISIKDWNNREIKSYKFDYSFIQKLFLKDITEVSATNEISKYSFSYKNNTISPADLKTDYWGYYKSLGSYCDNLVINNYLSENREVDKQYVNKDVLNQIIYPTKGSVVFEYEPNTYSYVSDVAVPTTNPLDGSIDYFENNPDNWTISQINDLSLNSSNGIEQTYYLGYINANKTLIFNSIIDNNEGIAGFLNLYKKSSSNQLIQTTTLRTDCPLEINVESGYKYTVGFRWDHLGQVGENPLPNPPVMGHANVVINEKTIKTNLNKWLYGGGIRIKNIYYLDKTDVVSQAELQNQGYPSIFTRRISFNYNFFDDTAKSSGSLVYPKPLMTYELMRKFKFINAACNINPDLRITNYRITTKLNNLSAISTQGADVGYKNVTISETGNGKSEYTYTSPIDYPETFTITAVKYPFAPTKNIDYKRGLLVSEKKYDNSSRLLTSNENTYDFENFEKITGVTLYYNGTDCPSAGSYLSYADYKSALASPNCNTSVVCMNTIVCGSPTNFISYYLNKEAFGWAKLMNTTSKNYFYTGTQTSVLNSATSFVYSANNMQPLKQTSTISDGTVNESSYSYAHEKGNQLMIDKNMVGIPLETTTTQTTGGVAKTISKTETIYPTSVPTTQTGNLVLPTSALSYDLQNGNPSTEVTYDKYDVKGNLQQYTTKDGVSTTIIWGYNQTQPIAKITGANLSDIQQSMIDSIVNASNSDASNPANEPALVTALDNFRNNSALAGYQISTYTYDPLIGVTSITPPSGIREVYLYDAANRLKEIREGNQTRKLLKVFKYNYKN